MKDLYKILGVNKCDSKDKIKKNYRKLCLKYHPDKTGGDKLSEEKFKEITEAYTILSHDESRKIYDIQSIFKDIQMTEGDYQLLLSYYNRVVNSKEYKLFKLLYNSIPSSVKEDIWEKFRGKNNQIIVAHKSIDITEMDEDNIINLVLSSYDYFQGILKIIYIFSKNGIYYLYLRKPNKKIVIDNYNCSLYINFFITN